MKKILVALVLCITLVGCHASAPHAQPSPHYTFPSYAPPPVNQAFKRCDLQLAQWTSGIVAGATNYNDVLYRFGASSWQYHAIVYVSSQALGRAEQYGLHSAALWSQHAITNFCRNKFGGYRG